MTPLHDQQLEDIAEANVPRSGDWSSTTGSEVFATTLRDISGMIITIEKGTRVRVTHQQEEDARCTIHLTEKDNPTRIWNTICGVPMKHLQFDPQNVSDHRCSLGASATTKKDTEL